MNVFRRKTEQDLIYRSRFLIYLGLYAFYFLPYCNLTMVSACLHH